MKLNEYHGIEVILIASNYHTFIEKYFLFQ